MLQLKGESGEQQEKECPRRQYLKVFSLNQSRTKRSFFLARKTHTKKRKERVESGRLIGTSISSDFGTSYSARTYVMWEGGLMEQKD